MISAGFFAINCSNSKVLKAMRDYMYTVEKRLGVVAEQSVKLPVAEAATD